MSTVSLLALDFCALPIGCRIRDRCDEEMVLLNTIQIDMSKVYIVLDLKTFA